MPAPYLRAILLCVAALLSVCTAEAATDRGVRGDLPLTFACAEDNDLYRAVIRSNGYTCRRFDNVTVALEGAPVGGAMLALADAYPGAGVSVAQGDLDLAAAKRLRLFVEFPEEFLAPRCTTMTADNENGCDGPEDADGLCGHCLFLSLSF